MRFERSIQIKACNYLSIDDKKRFVFKQMTNGIKRSGSSENDRVFNRICDFDAVLTAGADLFADRIWFVMKIDNDFCDAELLQLINRKSNERAIQKRDRGFRSLNCQRPESGSESSG